LGHTFKQTLYEDEEDTTLANDMNFNFGYTVNPRVKLSGGVTYSLDKSESRQWRVGGSYRRDCWDMQLSLRQDIVPRPTGYTNENTFYLQLNFIPFGSIGTGEGS
jgi:LPS-assembly protein